ncbi:tetratricopeptide repeat protein [Actinomadura nitritigenes]|uniref:tetratricopeptide repeat protein n=1 Tax=Actinomadura nitritigenes TaxID=134602 RepID=UPI003D904815
MGPSKGTAPEPLARFCARLRRLQEAAKLKQVALARAVNVSPQSMSDLLNGNIKELPAWERVQAIVDACLKAGAGRVLPPDLADRDGWRLRYTDLEQDLDALAGAPEPQGDDRGTAIEAVLRNGFLLASGERVPRVDEADPNVLGVHPAIQVARRTSGELPPYVPRDLDPELDGLLCRGGLVVISGRSGAGKTRTAFETVRRAFPGHDLLVPRNAAALRALADSGAALRDTVIWLDDIDRFLGTGEVDQQLDQQLVGRLCPGGRSDAVIVATVRSQALLDLSTASSPSGRTLARSVRALLAPAAVLTLDEGLSDAEREGAEPFRHDARIAEALDHAAESGFGEYLCAGPAILDRWRLGRAAEGGAALVGAALTSAAVHCRRAGCHAPLPLAVLERLYKDHLDPRDAQRPGLASVEDGLVWATESVRGASSCLVGHEGDRYRAFDYLTDSRDRAGDLGPVPDAVWTALLDELDPSELNLVALAARRADREDVFRRMQTRWAESVDDPAVWALTGSFFLFDGPGDRFPARAADARPWLVRAAGAGRPDAARNLWIMFDLLEDAEAAERWARRGAELGDGESMVRLGEFHEESGDLDEAERWYRKAADSGPMEARRTLLAPTLRFELGPYETRLSWIRGDYAEESSAPLSAIAHLGLLRAARGDLAESEELLRRAAAHGQMNDLLALAVFIMGCGKALDLRDWCRDAARAGRFDAVTELLAKLAETGDTIMAQRVRAFAVDAWRTEGGAFLARLDERGNDEPEPYLDGAGQVILLSLDAAAVAGVTDLCVRVMGVLALASGEGVSRELLHLAGSEGLFSPDTVSPRAVDDAIRRLADAALLTCDRDAPLVTAHPVVRRAVRDWLAVKGGTTALGGATCDMLRVAAARNGPGASTIAWHAFALGDHLTPHLGDEDRELAESLLGLRGWAFHHLLEDGQDGQAGRVAEAGERLVADGERLLGEAHPDTLRARNDLAAAYFEAGRIEEAVPLLERTLADVERTLGETHPETLTVRNNLAAAYLRAERTEEAVVLFERVFAQRAGALGGVHPDALTACANLAAAYAQVGRSADAIALLQQNLPESTRALGETHPVTLHLRQTLAKRYQEAGRAAEEQGGGL